MKLLMASSNTNKLEEIRRILSPLGVDVISPAEIGVDLEVEETGETFAENACIKALAYHNASGLAAIADDSGLQIDALGGRPGVHSARYQGKDAPSDVKIAAVLEELKDVPEEERTARFVCAVSCVIDKDTIVSCQETCEGFIGTKPAGEGGFGYDPIFYIGNRSMAQRSDEEKDTLSHRGKALRKFALMLEINLGRM